MRRDNNFVSYLPGSHRHWSSCYCCCFFVLNESNFSDNNLSRKISLKRCMWWILEIIFPAILFTPFVSACFYMTSKGLLIVPFEWSGFSLAGSKYFSFLLGNNLTGNLYCYLALFGCHVWLSWNMNRPNQPVFKLNLIQDYVLCKALKWRQLLISYAFSCW